MGNISESAPAVVQLVIHRLRRKKKRAHVVLLTCQCSRSRRGSGGAQSTLKVAWITLLEFSENEVVPRNDCGHIAALRSEACHGDEGPLDGASRVNRSTDPSYG